MVQPTLLAYNYSERYIWTPVVDQNSDTVFNSSTDHEDCGIVWVCSGGYCGDGVPAPGRGSDQHYFLLQASVEYVLDTFSVL